MAQSKLNDLAGRLGKNPKGLGLGLKLLALAGGAVYTINQAMYTGMFKRFIHFYICIIMNYGGSSN